MGTDRFERQVEILQNRVTELREQTNSEGSAWEEVLPRALEELQVSLAELYLAQEEMRQQNEELMVPRPARERERVWYQELFEFTPNGYLVTDPNGVIQEVNLGAAALLQVDRGYLVGKHLVAFVARGERLAFRYQLRRLVQGERVKNWMTRIQPREGLPIPVTIDVATVRNADDTLTDLCWLLHDITERKEVEEEIRRHTAQLEVLREVGLEIASQLEPDTLLRSIVSRAVELLGGTAGGLAIYKPDQDLLDYTVQVGISSVPRNTTLRRGEGFCGRIWETGESLIVNDYERWEGRSARWEKHLGHRADVGVPVRWGTVESGGEFLGVLDVLADPPRTFTQEDAELLSLFATQAAIAIRNVRLYEQAQRDLSERERAEKALREERDRAQQYLDLAGTILVAINTRGVVTLINQKGSQILGYTQEEIIGQNWFDRFLPANIKGEVRAALEMLMAGEIEPVEFYENPVLTKNGGQRLITWRNTPLRDETGQFIGTLSSGEDITQSRQMQEEIRRHRDQLEELVKERTTELTRANESLRSEISERVRAKEEQARLQRRLQALWGMARLVDADYDTLCDYVLVESVVMTESRYGFYGFLDQDETVMTLYAWSEEVTEHCLTHDKRLEYAIAEAGLWGEAVRQRRAIIINDYKEIDHPGKKGLPEGHVSLTNILVVPIFSQGRIVSLVAVANRETPYSEADAEQINAFVTNAEVILERMEIQRALAESEERYRTLFDRVPIGLYRTTSGGNSLDANQTLVEILGYPDRGSLLAVNSRDLYINPQDRSEWQAMMEREGVVRDYEKQVRRYDGTTIWTRDNGRVVRDAEGRVVQYEGSIEDITEWKQAQAALIRAERLEVAGKLVASLTHEINNPLQSVLGCLGLAQETLAEGGNVTQYLQIAYEELQRAARVVAQLRDLHQPSEPGRKELTDLNVVLEQVLTLNRKRFQECGIEVVWTPATGLPQVMLSADQIRQVCLNLVLNAIEAMPAFSSAEASPESAEGGRLEVSTGRIHQPAGVCITFRDTGVGIAPGVLPHIFDPFYSTKSDGLGLGLYVSETIVKEHEGHIEVESRFGEGTTFTVWLPA